MTIDNLLSVAIGGLIGFISAFGMEALKRKWKKREDEDDVRRLLEILYEEVEQLAELLDVDLGIIDLGDSRYPEDYYGKLKSTIARLQHNRIIFESQAERLLDLPS